MNGSERLKNIPVSSFSVSMGLAGAVISVQNMQGLLPLPSWIFLVSLLSAGAVFGLTGFVYGMKMARFPEDFRRELHHPVKMHFFPTFSVSLLLFSIATLQVWLLLSKVLWWAGASLHLAFTLFTLTNWVQKTHFEIHHANPSWFIPILGNLIIPVAGVVHAPPAVNWFFLSVGFFFWILMFAVLMNRLIFYSPVPEKLVPTFFILMAPPAVSFIAYVKITGGIDNFAVFLYSLMVFMILLVAAQWKLFKKTRFYLSSWAYSFPVAAIDLATILYYHETGSPLLKTAAVALFAILLGLVTLLVWMTLKQIRRHAICVEE